MRLLTAVHRQQPEKLEALSFALFQRHWGEGREVNDLDTLRSLLAAVGASEDLLSATEDSTTKAALKAASDEAVERGAFGFPAMFVQINGQEEMYFGSDRIPLLAFDLALPWEGPTLLRG